MRLDDLTDLMDELSRQTWFNLTMARQLDMRMGEVTISETNLLALARLIEDKGLPVELIATRADESTTGVDFEIWLVARNARFFGYSIQAKVIDVRNAKFTYPKLGHKAGATYQYELLETHALDVGSHPVHLFYNGWANRSPGAPGFPAGFDTELFGCAAVMTSVVHDVRDATTKPHGGTTRASVQAADYLSTAVPWSELFKRLDPPARAPKPSGPSDGTDVVLSSLPPYRDGAGGVLVTPGPSGPPRRPIDVNGRDLNALEKRLAVLSGEHFEPRRPSKLPDYVTQARGKARKQLPKNSDLPLFALVIEVG